MGEKERKPSLQVELSSKGADKPNLLPRRPPPARTQFTMALGRRRMFCVPGRRAKLPIGYRRRKRDVARDLYGELDQTVLDLKKKITELAKKYSRCVDIPA